MSGKFYNIISIRGFGLNMNALKRQLKKISIINEIYLYTQYRFIEILLFFFSDKYFIEREYRKFNNKAFKESELITFSDKLYAKKMSGELYAMSSFVDKFEVRKFVIDRIGENYLTALYDIIYDVKEIEYEKLPNQFVMKLNNGFGRNLIVKDKNATSEGELKGVIKRWLNSSPYLETRELQYKNVKHCVIFEEYLKCDTGIKDYKLFCFNGEPEFIQVISERCDGSQRNNFYDLDWLPLDISRDAHETGERESKPECLSEMLRAAKKLSSDFQFVRVDFYIINNKVIFGELTFTPANGKIRFLPAEFDLYLAEKISN